MSRPIISLITDFGSSDSYVGQLKGVILGINPEVQLVDITHAIPKQSISTASTVLDQAVAAFPDGTIHLVVVDPGVGSRRQMVAAEIGRWRFVAPNNGVLSAVLGRLKLANVVRLTRKQFWRAEISNTFHGRDIMGPVAAHWSLGVDMAKFGEPIASALTELPGKRSTRTADGIFGEVVWIDSFGNLMTNINASEISDRNRESLVIRIAENEIQGVHRCYDDVSEGTLVALFGSNGNLEIAVNGSSAAQVVNATVGSSVRVVGFEPAENE